MFPGFDLYDFHILHNMDRLTPAESDGQFLVFTPSSTWNKAERATDWIKFNDLNYSHAKVDTVFSNHTLKKMHMLYEPLLAFDGTVCFCFFFFAWFFVFWDFVGNLGLLGPNVFGERKKEENAIPSKFSKSRQNTCSVQITGAYSSNWCGRSDVCAAKNTWYHLFRCLVSTQL